MPFHNRCQAVTKSTGADGPGDEHARNMLIEHNLRLVAHIVKKFETQARMKDPDFHRNDRADQSNRKLFSRKRN